TLEPIMKPLDFSWKAATALLFGVAAKEVVVSTFSMLYGFGEEDLESAKLALSQEMNPAIAFAFLVFVMAYIPCLATVAVIKMETNSWKWPIFALVYSILVAYLLSFIAYNVGRLFL
ncbi:MAG TPA: ferrous iron transport protein B, partial [Thermotoga sp.]|nr:ferrous iron transport protein B [Thermotoga sp.]